MSGGRSDKSIDSGDRTLGLGEDSAGIVVDFVTEAMAMRV